MYWTGILDNIKNSPNIMADEDNSRVTAPTVRGRRLMEPNELNRQSNWEVDFRQIEPGEMDTRILVRESQNVALLEIHMDRAMHQRGYSPNDAVTVGLPFTPTLRSWLGAEVESPGLVYFGTAEEFDGFSVSGFAALTVSVSKPSLVRVADQIGLPLKDDLRGKHSLPLGRRSAAIDRLTASGRRLLHGIETPFGETEQEDLIAALISAMADAETFEDRSNHSTRARSVRRALDYLADRADDGISVGSICEGAGVSWRTLDRGFREQFGIGPKAYLNRLRLSRVRSELLRKGASTTIADAANVWGFWHMGQFAKDYFRMFGELPSETLRHARSN